MRLIRRSVIPYLEKSAAAATSRHPEAHGSYRAKVLGRALLATRTDVNSFGCLYPGMPSGPFVDNCDNHAGSFYNWCLVLLLLVMSYSPCFSEAQDLRPSRDHVRTEWNGWVDLIPVDYYYYTIYYIL
jgi:hypothetical protein